MIQFNAVMYDIKPTLRKKQDEAIIHAGTNNVGKDENYLRNVEIIVKLVRDTREDTNISFSLSVAITKRTSKSKLMLRARTYRTTVNKKIYHLSITTKSPNLTHL